MAGGGALLRGIDRLVAEETCLPVHIADDPLSAVAEGTASDKDLTKSLPKACGVPIPEGQVVNNPEQAWEAAQDIGLPVCVKPIDGNHGRGVFIDVTTREEVEMAYSVAVNEGSGVLVERSIPGTEHRLLIVGGKLAAAIAGQPVARAGSGAGRNPAFQLRVGGGAVW